MYGIKEQELKRCLALCDKVINQMIELKIQTIRQYEIEQQEEYPEDAKRDIKDYEPSHPDNK